MKRLSRFESTQMRTKGKIGSKTRWKPRVKRRISSLAARRRGITKSRYCLSSFYRWPASNIGSLPDLSPAADRAASVLSIFGSKSNARDAENQLMGLFEYQSFYAATAKFLKNRDATKLMRCDAEERINVEVAMRVDLESMAFSQGGHLMSNRKCKPPDAAPSSARRRVTGKFMFPRAEGDLVPLVSLLAWAREAFIVPKLNRAQSKLYPIAFGTDEPILLCVPTGAGKVCLNSYDRFSILIFFSD